jgi:hypothetical protein
MRPALPDCVERLPMQTEIDRFARNAKELLNAGEVIGQWLI